MEASVKMFKSTYLNHHISRSILTRHSLKLPPKSSSTIFHNTSRNPKLPLLSISYAPNDRHNLIQTTRFAPSGFHRSSSFVLSGSSLPLSNSNPLGFLLSLSSSHLLNSPVSNELFNQVDTKESYFSWHKALESVNGGNLGSLGKKGPVLTVVLLGWLGAKHKHLKRYVELYTSRGIHAVTFVVPVRDVSWFDLGRKVEKRISVLAEELVSWLSETEQDGRARCLLFHTFSNTGWLAYGAILDYLQSKGNFMDKIKGCTFDSGGDPEINPQVWAAGFCAAMLKKRSSAALPSVGSGVIGGEEFQADKEIFKVQDHTPHLIETLLLSALEKLFSFLLKLPDVNRRLTYIISILSKNQPSCPQLYFYSTADKVIPFGSVEMFIQGQRFIGKKVWANNFGSSPHVDHYRSFPHIYSMELHKFLKVCVTTDC